MPALSCPIPSQISVCRDKGCYVRFGSKADICSAKGHVRFTLNSDRDSGLPQQPMSALPPKADMCSALVHVYFGPKADIVLLNHFVRPGKYCRRNCEAQCLRGLEIDDKFVLVWRLHWQIGWLLALEDAVDIAGRLPELGH